MEIPDSNIQSIMNLVTDELHHLYNEHIRTITDTDFHTYFRKVLADVLDDVRNLVEVDNETLNPIVKRRYGTKKRWLDKELTSSGLGFYKEIEVVAKGLYEQLPENERAAKFEFMYGYPSYEALREARLIELNEWLKDENSPICSFRYINTKTAAQQNKAMMNDMEYLVIREIKEKCPKGKQKAIWAMPNAMSDVPVDHTNRVKFSPQSIVEDEQGKFLNNVYVIDDERYLESRFNVEELKEAVAEGIITKTLNLNDVNVFLHCMSMRNNDFFTTREIVVEIGDIVRSVFTSDATSNYIAVKESLYRMQYLNTQVRDENYRGFTMKIFDTVEIYKSTDGREMAQIIVNSGIVNQFVKKQTTSMYQEIIARFKLESSKFAIFPLQRERIKCWSANEQSSGESLILHTNYNFFRGVLYFSNKKKRENHRTIEKTLTEIVENKITLKSYVRKGDTYILEFYPMTNQERRDLLDNRDTKGIIEIPYEQSTLGIK